MTQQKMTSQQVKDEIVRLVEAIHKFDGTSGRSEEEWRKDQQDLVRLLSEYPLDLYHLSDEFKSQLREMVQSYLDWSFGGWW